MAVTWTVDIAVTNRAAKRIRVTAKRVDDVSGDEWSRTAEGQIDPQDLAGSRDKVVNTIWKRWQAHQTKQADEAALISGWETALENALDALEGA